MLSLLWGTARSPAATLYSTGFERSQGFDLRYTLAGQGGWLSEGTGGNGLVTNTFPGLGQQAYVGLFPPTGGDEGVSVWRPVNLAPIPRATPMIRFSVEMAILDSLNDAYDDFYWSLYNTNGQRLFSLHFDNYNLDINYLLDTTTVPVFTGFQFEPDTRYALVVVIECDRNRWSASLDGQPLVSNLPLTTQGQARNLGDFDAQWWVYDTNAPGDNFLVFDNYTLTAEPVPPPRMEALGRTANGAAQVRLHGLSGYRFALEASTNLTVWSALTTNTTAGGRFDYTDAGAVGLGRRFYRGRWVP